MRRLIFLALAGVWLAGCGGPSRAEEKARLDQIEADGRALDGAADRLESRLLADQASVYLWQELAWRHRHVSAIATVNANEHLQGMLKLISRQQRKKHAMRRRRIAAVEAVEVGGQARRHHHHPGRR